MKKNPNSKKQIIIIGAGIIVVAVALFFATLNNSVEVRRPSTMAKVNPEAVKLDKKTRDTVTKSTDIYIQPLGDFSEDHTQEIATRLKAMYSGNVIVNSPKPLPNNARNKTKTRFRADSLLVYLNEQTGEGGLTIGLTSKDISYTRRNEAGDISNDDWGIMGLGYQPGKSCVASTHRLKGTNQIEKLFKLAIHELGHTQGLQHCPVKGCLMMDAKGRDHFDELDDFCPKCKSVLKKSGWRLI